MEGETNMERDNDRNLEIEINLEKDKILEREIRNKNMEEINQAREIPIVTQPRRKTDVSREGDIIFEREVIIERDPSRERDQKKEYASNVRRKSRDDRTSNERNQKREEVNYVRRMSREDQKCEEINYARRKSRDDKTSIERDQKWNEVNSARRMSRDDKMSKERELNFEDMDESLEAEREVLEKLVRLLHSVQWLHNFPITQILSSGVLEGMPEGWRAALSDLPLHVLNLLPQGCTKPDWPPSLRKYLSECRRLSQMWPTYRSGSHGNAHIPDGLKRKMSEKKRHEVEGVVRLVGRVAGLTGSQHVLDIGSGRGYIDTCLHGALGVKVLGVESENSLVVSACKRQTELAGVCPGVMHCKWLLDDNEETMVIGEQMMERLVRQEDPCTCYYDAKCAALRNKASKPNVPGRGSVSGRDIFLSDNRPIGSSEVNVGNNHTETVEINVETPTVIASTSKEPDLKDALIKSNTVNYDAIGSLQDQEERVNTNTARNSIPCTANFTKDTHNEISKCEDSKFNEIESKGIPNLSDIARNLHSQEYDLKDICCNKAISKGVLKYTCCFDVSDTDSYVESSERSVCEEGKEVYTKGCQDPVTNTGTRNVHGKENISKEVQKLINLFKARGTESEVDHYEGNFCKNCKKLLLKESKERGLKILFVEKTANGPSKENIKYPAFIPGADQNEKLSKGEKGQPFVIFENVTEAPKQYGGGDFGNLPACTSVKLDMDSPCDNSCVLLGLHACADLSPIMIKLFQECPRATSLILLSCCYHKLEQREPDAQTDQTLEQRNSNEQTDKTPEHLANFKSPKVNVELCEKETGTSSFDIGFRLQKNADVKPQGIKSVFCLGKKLAEEDTQSQCSEMDKAPPHHTLSREAIEPNLVSASNPNIYSCKDTFMDTKIDIPQNSVLADANECAETNINASKSVAGNMPKKMENYPVTELNMIENSMDNEIKMAEITPATILPKTESTIETECTAPECSPKTNHEKKSEGNSKVEPKYSDNSFTAKSKYSENTPRSQPTIIKSTLQTENTPRSHPTIIESTLQTAERTANTDSTAENPTGTEFYNFPMSQTLSEILEENGLQLTVFGLRLAAQESGLTWKLKTPEEHTQHTRNVAYRGLLEQVCMKEGWRVKKLRRRCVRKSQFGSLQEYIHNVLEKYEFEDKLGANHGPSVCEGKCEEAAKLAQATKKKVVQQPINITDHDKDDKIRKPYDDKGRRVSTSSKPKGNVCFKCSVEEVKIIEDKASSGLKARITRAFEREYESHKHLFPLIEPFTALQLALQPAIESLVLLDRLVYLKECGFTFVWLEKIFKDELSPRSIALVALK